MCVYAFVCMRRARPCAFLRGCVPRLFACLCCCVAACLRPTTRLCLPIARPFHLRGPIFLFARYSTPAPPSCLPSTTLSSPSRPCCDSLSLSLPPSPSLCLSLSSTHLSPPVPAFSNPITLISYPVIRRLIDYFVRNCKRNITRS